MFTDPKYIFCKLKLKPLDGAKGDSWKCIAPQKFSDHFSKNVQISDCSNGHEIEENVILLRDRLRAENTQIFFAIKIPL